MQRSPLSEELSKNGIIKSANEIKEEICQCKLGIDYSNLVPQITSNLLNYAKDVKCYLVDLHNSQKVKGIPRVLSNLQYLNSISLTEGD